jgi:succinoglycan biosynthesis protein ExoM
MASLPHISVCICTFRRPEMLRHLLRELGGQETEGRFSFSVVVVDNDRLRSAEQVVADFSQNSSIACVYRLQPEQNIALARNLAVENAAGDYIVFIDDDEFPIKRWLLTLFDACRQYECDGVLGPVKPHFDDTAPKWVIAGRFYDRPSYPTGMVIDWKKGRTGNTFLKKEVFENEAQPFNPEFLTGEDQDFFRRMIGKGRVFIWCHEALAYETVPPIRWNRGFMLRRALLRGKTTILYPTFGALEVLKSMLAVPLYTIALPFAFLLGQHRFMSVLVRLFDHLGKILALVGIAPVKEQYVTE